MSLEMKDLTARRMNLVLQRAQAKDQIEAFERELHQVMFAIQVLEANQPKSETPPAE